LLPWRPSGHRLLALAACLLCLGGAATNARAQHPKIADSDYEKLRSLERQMAALGDTLLDGSSNTAKLGALKAYIPLLAKALRIEGAFYYPFDSLRFMFKLTPRDGRFRLLNWNVEFMDGTFRYFGAVQPAPEHQTGKAFYPLFDRSRELAGSEEDTIVDHESWYGAQYYEVQTFGEGPQKRYLLLGWDGYRRGNNKKIIEVIGFEADGSPRFGAPIFEHERRDMETGETIPFMATRRTFLFKEDAMMTLRFLPEKKLIAFSNLVPFSPRGDPRTYMVPDGAYNYYQYRGGRFYYGEDIFEKFREEISSVGGPEGEVRDDGSVEGTQKGREEGLLPGK
jgi:hypothetical protein